MREPVDIDKGKENFKINKKSYRLFEGKFKTKFRRNKIIQKLNLKIFFVNNTKTKIF